MLGVLFFILLILPYAIIRAIQIGPIFIILGGLILIIGGFFSIPVPGEEKNWKPFLMVLAIALCFFALGASLWNVYVRDIIW